MSVDKPNHVSQLLITGRNGGIVSAVMNDTPSSWLAEASPPSTKSPARSTGLYIKQRGTLTVYGAQSDLFLVDGEQAIISAPSWAEFRRYCDACSDVSVCLAGSLHGNGFADVLVFETQRIGKTCDVELVLIPRSPSADFPGRIPGSYPPPSPDLPSLLSAVPCTFPIDIPQSAGSGSILGLEGVPPLCEASCITSSLAGLNIGNHLDYAHDSGIERNAVLAFVVTLPTTLRDLAEHAGVMSLLDGAVVTP
jgi:hypothetical protein